MLDFVKSTIGRKYIMGLTGLVWAGFVLAHMAGNMLIFVSSDAYNTYGHMITSGNFIYVAEAVLIIALVTHIISAISLTRQNRQARPRSYAIDPNGDKGARLASKTMAAQGLIILTFIITHLITFKFGTYYETTVNGVVMRDLARLMFEVFQSPIYVGWYLVSLALLCAHLSHGFGSVFQSFGILERHMQGPLKKLSWTYAIVVTFGFVSQPLYILIFK